MSYERGLAWLARHRNADGSWGYTPGSTGRAEPTLLAAAAGADLPLRWLESADLGWGELLLPAVAGDAPAAAALRSRALAHILSAQANLVGDPYDVFDHDTRLPGWSWVPNTTPWVEPTCYAVLSLKRSGLGDHERVAQGEALLRDRQCDDGGWNYGNTGVFDARLDSSPGPTAWACLALPMGPEVERGLARLRAPAPSGTSLSLAILARLAHGAPLGDLPDRLGARQQQDGAFNDRVDTTALATAALRAVREGTHVFDVTS